MFFHQAWAVHIQQLRACTGGGGGGLALHWQQPAGTQSGLCTEWKLCVQLHVLDGAGESRQPGSCHAFLGERWLSDCRVLWFCLLLCLCNRRSRDSLVVRVPESWLKGPWVQVTAGAAGGFSSPWSNFCADLFQYLFYTCVKAVAPERSWSFCQKCMWQVTAKHTYSLHDYVAWNEVTL